MANLDTIDGTPVSEWINSTAAWLHYIPEGSWGTYLGFTIPVSTQLSGNSLTNLFNALTASFSSLSQDLDARTQALAVIASQVRRGLATTAAAESAAAQVQSHNLNYYLNTYDPAGTATTSVVDTLTGEKAFPAWVYLVVGGAALFALAPTINSLFSIGAVEYKRRRG